jgi:hypothetical protein
LSPFAVNQAVFEQSLDRLGLVDFSGQLLREATGTGGVTGPIGAVAQKSGLAGFVELLPQFCGR